MKELTTKDVIRLIPLAVRLFTQDVKREKRFNDVTWKEAVTRVGKRYQLKGRVIRERRAHVRN